MEANVVFNTKNVANKIGHAPVCGDTFDNDTEVRHGIVTRVTWTRYRVAMVMADKVIADVIDSEGYDEVDNIGIFS